MSFIYSYPYTFSYRGIIKSGLKWDFVGLVPAA